MTHCQVSPSGPYGPLRLVWDGINIFLRLLVGKFLPNSLVFQGHSVYSSVRFELIHGDQRIKFDK